MPDYRELIERVQARGGPLKVGTVQRVWGDGSEYTVVRWGEPGQHVSLALQDMYMPEEDKDVLAGVLRRDLAQRGFYVEYLQRPMPPRNDGSHRIRVDSGDLDDGDMLTAFLRAWLEAVPEEANA